MLVLSPKVFDLQQILLDYGKVIFYLLCHNILLDICTERSLVSQLRFTTLICLVLFQF